MAAFKTGSAKTGPQHHKISMSILVLRNETQASYSVLATIAHHFPLSFSQPIKLPQHVTYLVKLVGIVIAALKLLVKHTILLCEDLHHLLGSLHDCKGIWSKLLARGGGWRLWSSSQAHGKRKRQGDGVQRSTDGGSLRGHGAVLLHRGWKGKLAWPAVGKRGPVVRLQS